MTFQNMTFLFQFQLMAEEFSSRCGGGDGGVFFLRVDVDECPEIAKEFGIEVLPSLLLVKNGELLSSFIGQDLERVRREIQLLSKEGGDGRRTSTHLDPHAHAPLPPTDVDHKDR